MEEIILSVSIMISGRYDNVKRCLDSVQTLLKRVPSELILTDTGCDQRVRKLIEGYSDNIIDFNWCKDFSAARNAGLCQAKGKWFMYLDDDEWFEDTKAIEDFFTSRECQEYKVAYYTQRNYTQPKEALKGDGYTNKISEISFLDHYVDRIIRIVPGLHFEGRVHEAYTGIKIGKKKKLECFVHHYGYAYSNPEDKNKKLLRNKELLELEVAEHPEDMRMRYQLTTSYFSCEKWEEAKNLARESIKQESKSAYWDEIHNCILYCLQKEEKWQELIETAREFLDKNLYPYSYLGVKQYLLKAYWKMQDYDNVVDIGKQLLNIYADYKADPRKYDCNQILLDEYLREDTIMSIFLMLIDAALEIKNQKIVSLLAKEVFSEERKALIEKSEYCFALVNIIKERCKSYDKQLFLEKLPFPKSFIEKLLEDINNSKDTFLRPQVSLEGCIKEPIELKDLSFPVEFFAGETRNDFYIEPLMKHAWASELNILYKVGQICQANNIPYYVDWGTLLGTVRHKGFIPWDDDIDITMLHSDMYKLAHIIEDQYKELMFIDCYNSKDHGMQAFRVANTRRLLVDRADLKDAYGFVFPGGIDIFPLDKLPEAEAEREEMKAVHHWIGIADDMHKALNKRSLLDDDYFIKVRVIKTAVEQIEKLCQLDFEGRIPSNQELMILMDEVESFYRNEDIEDLTHLFAFCGKNFIVKWENYNEVIMMPFENIMVPVPVGYDKILTGEYGRDYMTPKHVASSHNYPFYKEYFTTLAEAKKEADLDEFRRKIEKQSAKYYINRLKANSEPRLGYQDEELASEDEVIHELKLIRAAEAEVLEEIKRICQDHNFSLFAINDKESESLAEGKFRLDGKLQLGMWRNQYKKFIALLPEELDVWFDYRDLYHNTKNIELKTYIITDPYKMNEEAYRKRFHGCSHIVGLTIEPIDGLYQEDSKESLRQKIFAGLLKAGNLAPQKGPYSQSDIKLIDEWKSIVKINYTDSCNLRQEYVRAADILAAACDIAQAAKVAVFRNPLEETLSAWQKSDFDHCREVSFGKSSILMPEILLER